MLNLTLMLLAYVFFGTSWRAWPNGGSSRLYIGILNYTS